MPSPATHVSCNGVLVPAAEARISVFNPAIYGAWGVYESLQVVNGRMFEPLAHLRRLAHSAALIELPLPADLPTIHGWMAIVAANYGQPTLTIRMFVIGPDNGGETIAYIWGQPPNGYPAHYYVTGATAATFEGRRYLPEAKSLNALASFMAQRHARKVGVHEALLHHAGCLTEGSNSNLFAVIAGRVVTPPHTEVLSGVTRDSVIRLAHENEIDLAEAELPVEAIDGWSEAFITSTSRHIMPVTAINARPVGSGEVGPLTRRLHDLFETYFVSQVGLPHE